MIKKICFIAPSGFGKSTAVAILKKHYAIQNIKIAAPLYEIQSYFYNLIKTPLKGEQDGEILQFFGSKIRKENPTFLLDTFEEKVNNAADSFDFITNDDCRPLDFEKVKEMGFILVGINGYKRERQDHSPLNTKDKNEWLEMIKCDYYVDNFDTMEIYENNLLALIDKIKE